MNCQNFVVKIILQLNVVSYDRYENCDFFMCLFVFQTLQSDKYQAKIKKESMADDLTIFLTKSKQKLVHFRPHQCSFCGATRTICRLGI